MFTPDQLNQLLAEFKKNPPQGYEDVPSGGTARIYKKFIGSTPVALKVFKELNTDDFYDEVTIIGLLRAHPHIPNYYANCQSTHTIVMEWVPKGHLVDYIQDNYKSITYPVARIKCLLGLAKALLFLEGLKIIHRDIKLQNVLIDEHDEAKLCDFGFAYKLQPHETIHKDGLLGTICYFAPEVVVNQPSEYSFASDIWAFCIALWMMYSLHSPYLSQEDHNKHIIRHKLVHHLAEGGHPDENLITDAPLRRLVLKVWTSAPDSRPKIVDMIKELEKAQEPDQKPIKRESSSKGKCQLL